MKFLKKILKERKGLAFVSLGVAALSLSAPSMAHAEGVVAAATSVFTGVLTGVLAVAIGWPVFILNYIVAGILGLAVPFISYFISVILQLNMNIIKSNIVGSGFTVTLSLANLGFVMAIIVIAIMTIIRYESYALKQTLWKLVAAAILVNFSLVICASILTFSDSLSFYFLKNINQNSADSPFTGFSSAIANGFNPQRIFLTGFGGSGAGGNAASGNVQSADSLSSITADAGTKFGSILTFIASLFFPTIFLAVAVIALGSLFIMLLIRYVYLGILLILMPMAWLLWIFPITSGQWQKWWSKFIQWTMFAPILLFFIWLAILTMKGTDSSNIQGIAFQSPSQNPISQGIGSLLSSLLGPLLQMTMMIAMVFAGLFMAQAMGITFAGAAIKGASWVTSGIGKGVGGFAKRRALIGAGAAMRKSGLQNVAQRFEKFGASRKGVIGRTLSLPSRLAGRAVEATMVATTEDLVKDAQARLTSQTNDQLVHGIPSTFTTPERIAAMKELGKRGILDTANMDDTHSKETKELFGTYKQAHEYEKEIEKKSGVSSEMYEALKGGASQEIINDLAVKFAKTFSRAEVSAMQAADLFSNVDPGKKKFGLDNDGLRKVSSATAYGFAVAGPQFASSILSKLKSSSLENFAGNEERRTPGDYIKGLESAVNREVISADEGNKRVGAFRNSIANNTMGFVSITETPAAPAAGTPPPAH